MKASVLTAFGPPEVLQLREVAAPVAKGHDVLIRVRATSVNFGDLLVRNFATLSPRAFHMPWQFWLIGRLSFGLRRPRVRILRSEFSGTVEAVGAHVTQFEKGDAVFGCSGPSMGAYAELLCVPERAVLALKSTKLGNEEAAACPYGALMTLGLLRKVRRQRQQRVLVVGASGGHRPHGHPAGKEPLRRHGGRRLRHGSATTTTSKSAREPSRRCWRCARTCASRTVAVRE